MKKERLTIEQVHEIPRDILDVMHLRLQESFDQIIRQNDDLLRQNEELIGKVASLEERIAVLTQRMFGRKTEKLSEMDSAQLAFDLSAQGVPILNEAEKLTEDGLPDEPEERAVIIRRKKPKGKRELDLRYAEEVIEPAFEIPEEKLKELFPKGYTRLKDETYSKLEHIPEHFVHHRYTICVYAGNHGEGIVRADRPEQLLPNSILTPSLFAGIANSKFTDAMPLNRISEEYARLGVNISRQDMAGWMIRISDRYLSMIYRAMKTSLLKAKLIHCDETPFQVVRDGRGPNSKSYMWVYHTTGKYGAQPIYIYQYETGRSSGIPREFLAGFKGILLTDGYQVYHTLEKERPKDLIVAGCWAHAKRKFAELVKTGASKDAGKTISAEAVRRIAAIYHADNMFKDASPDERLRHRQESVKPLVKAYFDWLEGIDPLTLDKGSDLYKAIQYSLNQKVFLMRFLEDPIIPLDNNDAERSIRKFCVGKHSWHVISTPKGASASAMMYSIVETAKANGLKPYEYIKYVLEQMLVHAEDTPAAYLDDLMPWSEQIPESARAFKF